MKGEQRELPLSPPLSPMTNHLARIDEWRHQIEYEGPMDSAHESISPSRPTSLHVRPIPQGVKQPTNVKEPLHSHYNQWNSRGTTEYANIAPANCSNGPGYQSVASADLPRTVNEVSAPVTNDQDQVQRYAEDEDIELSDLEPYEAQDNAFVTVAELRAHNRRLKRFRLTHSQTRYLMSEFARQPRPDAAQRERLSREIPGFSGRQVQVWFQNRRAKLKRLTNDDRERVLRSRALPANFDMTQALQSPFTGSRSVFHPPIQPSVPKAEPSAWQRPAADARQNAPLLGHGMQYQRRASYASPTEHMSFKAQQAASYMATPASLSSTAPSPRYVTRPGANESADISTPHSTPNIASSYFVNQDSRAQSANAGNSMSSVPELRHLGNSRTHNYNQSQGPNPSSFQSARLPQRWPVTGTEPTVTDITYDQALSHPSSRERLWNTTSNWSASHPNFSLDGRQYNLQERGNMVGIGEHDSINFEPLYRQHEQPRIGYEPVLQSWGPGVWKAGDQNAVAAASSISAPAQFKSFSRS